MSINPPSAVFQEKKFLEMLSHNRQVANTVVQTFLEQSDKLFQEIERANEQGDLKALIGNFHKLAGSASSISAEAFGKLCKATELELQYFQDNHEHQNPWIASEDLQEIQEAYEKLEVELRRFLKKG